MLVDDKIKRTRMLLGEWARADKLCAELLNDLRVLSNMIDDMRGINGSSISDGQPRGSGISDPTAATVISLESIRAEFERTAEYTQTEITRLQLLRRVIDELVRELLPIEREIIRMKYKLGHKMVYIAMRLEVAERTAYNYEESAVEKISRSCSVLQEI